MATGGDQTTRKENGRSSLCAVCGEPYGKRRCPKMLPCTHTFCMPCLIALEASAVAVATAFSRRHVDHQEQMSDSLSGPQTDSESDKSECDNISRNTDHSTISGGVDAQQNYVFLCPTCRTLVSVPTGGVSFFQTDPSLIGDHLTTGFLNQPMQADGLLQAAQQQLEVLESSLKRLELDGKVLTRQAQNIQRQINSRYNAIVSNIKQSCDELLKEFSELVGGALSQLEAQKSSASQAASTLSRLISSATDTGRSGEDDVTSRRNELRAALLSEDTLEHHLKQAVRQMSPSRWTYRVAADLDNVSALTVAGCMGKVVLVTAEAGACDVTKPPSVSAEDLTRRLERLEKEVRNGKGNADYVTAAELAHRLDHLEKRVAGVQMGADDMASPVSIAADLADRLHHLEKQVADVKASADYVTSPLSIAPELADRLERVEKDIVDIKPGADYVTSPLSIAAELADRLDNLEKQSASAKMDADDVTSPIATAVTQLADRLDHLEKQIAGSKKDSDDVTSPIAITVAQLADCLDHLEKKIAGAKKDSDDVTSHIAIAVAQLADRLDHLEKQIAAAKKDSDDVTSPTVIAATELANRLERLEKDVADFKGDANDNDDDDTRSTHIATAAELTDRLERLEKDVSETKSAVAQNKTGLAKTASDVAETMLDVNTNMKEQVSKLSRLENAVSNNGVIGTEFIEAITTVVEEQACKIAKSGKMVAFQAVCMDRERSDQYKPIIFRELKANDGGCYEPETGMFTAPARGIYIFSAAVRKEFEKPGCVGAWITVNGKPKTVLLGSSMSTGSNSVSVQLEKDHKVWVTAWNSPDEYVRLQDVCFTGALVLPHL